MIEVKRARPHEFKLDEQGAVTVAFAQLDVIDRDGDVTLAGAFPAKDVPMSAYGHSSWDGALPIGRGSIRETAGWAVFDGAFLMDTDQGRNAYATVKAMADLQEWSYGYEATEASYGQRDGRSVRFLKGIEPYEISPVLVGAGIGTHTMAIKSGGPGPGLPYADHLEGLLEEWKAFLDRSRDRADFRAKEGRTLSAPSRERLIELHGLWLAAEAELGTFLEGTDPAKGQRDREVAALLELSRFHGVPIG
jgi:hypothetical protein